MEKKEYYINLINEHKKVLSKARNLIFSMLEKLEEEISDDEASSIANIDKKSNIKFWWGEKESASSILSKMTALLLKLIPLELEIARTDLTKADLSELEGISQNITVDKDDIDILEQYAERILNSHSSASNIKTEDTNDN